jgi:hypothetical protein
MSERGVLKTIKDYLKSYVDPWYVGPAILTGLYGAACAVGGYAICEVGKRALEGLQYTIHHFPYIDLYKGFDYAIKSFSEISSQSFGEGIKGFIQFYVGSVFVMKFFRNIVGKLWRR